MEDLFLFGFNGWKFFIVDLSPQYKKTLFSKFRIVEGDVLIVFV